MPLHDTSADANRAYFAALRQMTGAERAQAVLELSELTLETARAGIRARHGDYDETRVHLALCRLTLGDDLFRRAYPSAPLVDP